MIHALTFAAYTVTLNGKTVLPHARAMVLAGHVLLPVRALGNAVGADIGYDGRTHVVTVQRGAHVARIALTCRTCVVHGTSYAPLRSVAAAFGLDVGYDAPTRTVALRDGGAPLARTAPPANLPAPALAPAAAGAFVISETPRNGAQIHEPYPAISVRFAGATAIDPRSLRVLVDGRDVTGDASVVGDQVLFTPRAALGPGTHSVAVTGRDASTGAALADAWSFDDSFTFAVGPAPTPYPVSAIWVDRWIVPGTNAFDVYVEGAPGITGYVGVDGVGGFFPLTVNSAYSYVAHVFVPNGVNQPFARIAARITLPNGELQTIVLPQRFNLVTAPLALPTTSYPTRPAPTPSPRPVPTRRSVDVPAPSPAPPQRNPLTGAPTPVASQTPTSRPAPSHTTGPQPVPSHTPLPQPPKLIRPSLTVRTPAPPTTIPATTPTLAPAAARTTPPPSPQPTRRPQTRHTPRPTPTPTTPP